jgi:26S proteasome regulatory subunit T2
LDTKLTPNGLELKMGNQFPNMPGGNQGRGDRNREEEKKRQPEQRLPTRVGKKKKRKGVTNAAKLPTVNPIAKCRLRHLRLERIKDYLLLEEEFIKN